ncbi:hypothetical protein EB118_03445 [bacterium]|nr:hypothetical protein [bacterium]NDC94033.1 hypothetical protein [bacterium]NDD82719.1 hypothetical protein [bacterium]NDG29140.1 hypothetical protein [bacterium]
MPKFVMSDGRAFTNYAPNCELLRGIQKKYKLSANDLRNYMQKNADAIKADLFPQQPFDDIVKCPVCEAALAYKPQGNTN